MKKEIKLFLTLLTCAVFVLSAVSASGLNVQAQGAADGTVSYTADFSSGAPADWTAYGKSDHGNSTLVKSDAGVKLSHSNASINAGLYYGGVYDVATEVGNLSDFQLTVDFRFLRWDDTSRWFGIFYHTQKNSSKMMESYLMNIRVNGNSAQSSVTATPTFTDTTPVNYGQTLGDDQVHTARIVVQNGVASHYIDDKEMITYSLESKSGLMGGVLVDGGFAIVANRCDVEISSFTLTGTQGGEAPSKNKADETIASGYVAKTTLSVAPSVVTYINSDADIDQLIDAETPATAILNVDKDLNVLGAEGENLGSLDKTYSNYLRGEVIPAVYVDDQAEADAFVKYLANVRNLLDIAVVSNDPALVEYVRKLNPKIRGIVDYSGENLEYDDMAAVVAESNKSYANIVILNEQSATRENVEFLHARFKAAWVKTDAKTEFDIASVISSGCFGIVTPYVTAVYKTYAKYDLQKSMSRTPFNIAHRGLCISNYENSLEGYIEAYEKGATHIEVDLQMSKDGHLVVMHDATLNRTTNGTGNVSSYTLAELKNFKIIKNANGAVLGDGVAIPTLEDVFKQFDDTDLVLVLEIKTGDLKAATVMKELMKQYDVQDQSVVIAFGVGQLEQFKNDFPEIPTANLNTVNGTNFPSALHSANSYNTVFDTGYGNVNPNFMTYQLRDRGFLAYLWTYGSYSEIANNFTYGVVGMTNNAADSIGYYAKELFVSNDKMELTRSEWENGEVTAQIKTYDGQIKTVDVKPFMIEEKDDGLYAIFSYQFYSSEMICNYNLFTEAVKIVFTDDIQNSQEGGKCKSSLSGGSVLCIMLASAGAFAYKKRRINK